MEKAKKEARGVMYAEIEIEVKDKDGKITETRRLRSHSFVANMLRALRNLFLVVAGSVGGTTRYIFYSSAEIIDTVGTSRGIIHGGSSGTSYPPGYPVLKANADVGDVTHGIRVGTGTTAPTPTDYNLASPIAEGTGTGQLSHGAVTVEAISIVGSTVTLRVIRTFTNNSGAAITVNEIGLFARATSGIETAYSTMLARDVFPSPISVPFNSTLTVRYLLRTTV